MSNLVKGGDVNHWGFKVPNMEEAVKAWKAMGAEIIVEPQLEAGVSAKLCFLMYRGLPIELVAPADDGDGGEDSADGGGLDHVCFFTDDMDGDLAAAKSDGAEIMLPPTYNSIFDRLFAFTATPGGLIVEYMNRKAEGKKSTDPLAGHLNQS